jgi:prophage regulatory protein
MVLRLPAVIQRMGRSRSSIYQDIDRGVFLKPIKLGLRSVGWLTSEVDTLIEARIAGLDEDEIRDLVELLVKDRSSLRIRELLVKDRSTLRTR